MGIILLDLLITIFWFRRGLVFGGGEDSLIFYDPVKTYQLYSSVWYGIGTGYYAVIILPHVPFFWILSLASSYNFSNVFLQASTFFLLMVIGCLSIYFLIQETIVKEIEFKHKDVVPFIAAIFYLLNPYTMNQLWGRGLVFQFFAFAFVPLFLCLFIVGLKRGNLIYGLFGVLSSFFLSVVYTHPAYVMTSWAPIGLFLSFHIYNNRKNLNKVFFGVIYTIVIFIAWILINWFWIHPLILQRDQLLEVSSITSSVESLKGVSGHIPLQAVIRLVHNGAYYIDELYGNHYNGLLFLVISWLIPIVAFFSLSVIKQSRYFKYYVSLFVVSLFISIGYNFPTGWLLAWIFENIPMIQVLRNPYEKFGVNLLIAYTAFFPIGVLVISDKIARYFKKPNLYLPSLFLILSLTSIVFVWPMWTGNFAGGYKFNPWVGAPSYYKEADEWLNSQAEGNFRILQVPLIPGDGIRYTWENSYQGIEPSQFLFAKSSISKDSEFNKNFYSVLVERFGRTAVGAYLPGRGTDNKDFREEHLYQELAKLNIRYIVLHSDMDWKFSGSVGPDETRQYLKAQPNISKVSTFGQLEIYKVEYPTNIDLIYSPSNTITYRKENNAHYVVNVNNATEPFEIYFLNLFDPMWQAEIDGKKMEDHYKIFSYGNAWNVDKKGNYTIEVSYAPQENYYSGFFVTKVSLITLIFLIIIGIISKRKIN